MTTHLISKATEPAKAIGSPSYTTREGLRALLVRLHIDGSDAWKSDPEATDLLRHCGTKYRALARRYRQTEHDAMLAAFDVLRAAATIEADDPWAVVTHAVHLTLQANERADALLCSTGTARRIMAEGDHDVVRFAEREDRTWDSELTPVQAGIAAPGYGIPGLAWRISPFEVRVCTSNAVELLASLWWPRAVAELGVEYVCSRLALSGSVTTAFEYLRRDVVPPRLLDISHRAWVTLCRALLGPDDVPGAERGVLRRLLLGESVHGLLADDRLVATLASARPQLAGVA
ncbi:hypothetical protein [Promicromonospora soli]